MKILEKFDLKGRAALVTGGGGLLGAEFCKALAEAGALNTDLSNVFRALVALAWVNPDLPKEGHLQRAVARLTDYRPAGKPFSDLQLGFAEEQGDLRQVRITWNRDAFWTKSTRVEEESDKAA